MANNNQLPHNLEAEESVIGAVLNNPSVYVTIDLQSYEFYNHKHRWIWDALGKLDTIDFVTVVEQLDAMGHLANVGGAAYITALSNAVPSSLHAEKYAAIIREKYIRRQTIENANALARAAMNDETDIVEARATIAHDLASTTGTGGAVHISRWLSDGFDMIEHWANNPREHAGLSTGLGDLDRVFGDGLLPGLNLLLGKPGMGKSILAQSIALNLIEQKIPGVFYAGEMDWRDMYLRIISDKSNVRVSDLRRGTADYNLVTTATESLNNAPFFVDDPDNMTTSALRADLTKLKIEHNIQWCVFDFLTDLSDLEGKIDGWQRAEILASRVQSILKSLDIAGLFVHELTKWGMQQQGDMTGISGGKKVAYRATSAVAVREHLPPANEEPVADYRTIINIKPPRLVEGYKQSCNLYKNPHYPRFGLTTTTSEFDL